MTIDELKKKMPEISGFLFAYPNAQNERVTEAWFKFRKSGVYLCIPLEYTFPKNIELQKLVGKGNMLNCSEDKKDELIAYVEKRKILEVLDKSSNSKANNEETISKIKELINIPKGLFIHN